METPDHRLTQTATLTYRTVGPASAKDPYGNPVAAESTVEVACWTEPSGRADERSETDGTSTVQSESLTIYLPAGTPWDGLVKVEVDGKEYEGIGPASRHFNPRTAQHVYVAATIRRGA